MIIILSFLLLVIILILLILNFIKCNNEKLTNLINIPNIPIVIIAYNNYTFVKNFIYQLLHLKNNIIIIDNNSTYKPLLSFYNYISNYYNIKVIKLNKNYGHEVYLKRKDLLPNIYILSDPDLKLNNNMPKNVSDILYNLSNHYKKFKVGLCLDISDSHLFINTTNYMNIKNMTIENWEKKFWEKKIINKKYELYNANIDTTFTLVNWNYYKNNKYDGIRIGKNFTAKHLPWYKNYIEYNIPNEELKFMKNNNTSSTIFNKI